MYNPNQPREASGEFGSFNRDDMGTNILGGQDVDKPSPEELMDELMKTNEFQRNKIRLRRFDDGSTAMMLMADYAATPKGKRYLEKMSEEFSSDAKTKQWLRSCIINGEKRKVEAKAVATAERKEREKANRAERQSMSTLRANPNVKNPLSEKFPEIAAQWDYERNLDEDGNVVPPEHVAFKANSNVWFVCEQGHHYRYRLNNRTNLADKGRDPGCQYCNGSRQKTFEKYRGSLNDLQDSLNGNPDAWEALPPAVRYRLLAERGDLNGNDFQRATALSLASGDITLNEVMTAQNVIDLNIDESLDSDDAELKKTIRDDGDDAVAEEGVNRGVTSEDRVANIMDAAGVGNLVSDSDELSQMVVEESATALWNEVHDDESNAGNVMAQIRKSAAGDPFRERVANQFTDELKAAQEFKMPEGWNPYREDKETGKITEIEPSLMQRRFALKALQDRSVLNLSGTGQGKTIAAVLATTSDGARETLVVAPANVTDQWADEYRKSFPGMDVQMGLPKAGQTIPETDKPRVWVVTHNAFSQDPKDVQQRVDGLQGRLDAVVFDEVHRLKSNDETEDSKRRRFMEKFMDANREGNPNMMVIGQSATPVITDLSEAKSLLKLVNGEAPANFQTKPTIKNMMAAHGHLAANGIRYNPAVKNMDRDDTHIDITRSAPEVLKRVKALQKEAGTDTLHPSMMEQALLPEKLPAITENVRKAKADGSPTVIYTKYTTGITEPMKAHLEKEGFRVACFTGDQPAAERAENKRKFENGELDVLIGSDSIGTGVDGLQSVSNNMIVAVMPNTAADDEQIVGRLDRKGQSKRVKVSYMMTHANVGGGNSWSYCKGRKNRIDFRRSMADAVTDGVVSNGEVFESETHAAGRALETLSTFASQE